MKHPVLSIICLLVLSTVTAQRAKYNFNSNWKVFVGDDSAASAILYNDETEVSGQKLDDGVLRSDATGKGTLSIIEAELYEIVGLKK